MGWIAIAVVIVTLPEIVFNLSFDILWSTRLAIAWPLILGLLAVGLRLLHVGGAKAATKWLNIAFGIFFLLISLSLFLSLCFVILYHPYEYYEYVWLSSNNFIRAMIWVSTKPDEWLTTTNFIGAIALLLVWVFVGSTCLKSVNREYLRRMSYGYGFASLLWILLLIWKYIPPTTPSSSPPELIYVICEGFLLVCGFILFTSLYTKKGISFRVQKNESNTTTDVENTNSDSNIDYKPHDDGLSGFGSSRANKIIKYHGIARNVTWHERATGSYASSSSKTSVGSSSGNTDAATKYLTELNFRLEENDANGDVTGYRFFSISVGTTNSKTDMNTFLSLWLGNENEEGNNEKTWFKRCIVDGDEIEITLTKDWAGAFNCEKIINRSVNGATVYLRAENTRVAIDISDISANQNPIGFSTKHINYLERGYLSEAETTTNDILSDVVYPEAEGLSFVKISGISNLRLESSSSLASRTFSNVLTGLYNQNIPIIFIITGHQSQTSLYIGTFNKTKKSNLQPSVQPYEAQFRQTVGNNLSVVISALQSAYPGVMLERIQPEEVTSLQTSLRALMGTGLVVGTPAVKSDANIDSLFDVRHITRGMSGENWAYIVTCMPVDLSENSQLHNNILMELADIANTEKSSNTLHPTAQNYVDLLHTLLRKLEHGKAQGLWHSAMYLMASDHERLRNLGALIASATNGPNSRPDPIRILEFEGLSIAMSIFSIFTSPAPASPGRIRYPYKFLSLNSSVELASVVHLPLSEIPGYEVREDASFDTNSSQKLTKNVIRVGEIVDHRRNTDSYYYIPLADLNRHAMIVGATGSGKTNTTFHLLLQLWNLKIPFLVIEPTKTEYRKLLDSEALTKVLRIFTLGDETTSPFRLNPFQILPGVAVQTHIDFLKSVFNASFVMYAPMPYVLERCLHEIYEDKGWNLATGENERGLHPRAFPTLTDLYRKIEPVVRLLGYEPKITMDVTAALQTRINSLREGGKGLMLDTHQSIPIVDLLNYPTILELDRIGDNDDKAFLISLLLTFLYEHRVSEGLTNDLPVKHVTVFEEAHRLLGHIPQIFNTEIANVKGKAVESFCNMLSEIRVYGEGFLVVEQIPSKLSPDIIKNTNLKVMQRLVAADERRVMGAAMNLNEAQARRVVSLEVGEAVVYSEGHDKPVLVAIPHCVDILPKSNNISRQQWDEQVRNCMVSYGLNLSKSLAASKYKREIIPIVETSEFKQIVARYILSVVTSESALITEFSLIIQCISKFSRRGIYDPEIISYAIYYGVDNYFEERGRQYSWKYQDADLIEQIFLSLINEIVLTRFKQNDTQHDFSDEEKKKIEKFRNAYIKLCTVPTYPFSGCSKICTNNVCLYRYNMIPLLSDARLHGNFMNALERSSNDKRWSNLHDTCQVVTRRVLSDDSVPEEKKKAELCFAVQKSELIPQYDHWHRTMIVDELMRTLRNWTFDKAKLTPSQAGMKK